MNISIYPKRELLSRWSEDRKEYAGASGMTPCCLRCGKRLPAKLGECALSRYIDVSICPDCGASEAILDWDGKAKPFRDWYALRYGLIKTDKASSEVVLVPTCGFQDVFEQPRRAVCGHPSGFPMSELCYVRADHNGYRWYNTWEHCQDMPKDIALFREIDGFYDALIALPEFKNLHTLRKMCRSCAEQVAEEDPNTFNLYAETEHFYIWLRLITRERDYNLYCHYYFKDWEEREGHSCAAESL